jgi:predicted dehydrogenase
MLAHEKLDGIVASQQFTHHGRILPPLYESGVPVFTEKPLAGSPQVAEQLAALCRKRGTMHMVGYHKRSDPAVIHAKAEIERLKKTGELGPLQYVRILMPAGDWIAGGFDELIDTGEAPPSLPEDPPPEGMSAETAKKFWIFVNFYIHQVNLMRHLLGEPYSLEYADRSGVMLAVRSRSGVCGVIEMSPYQTTADWQESIIVAFRHGWIKVDLPAPLAAAQPGQVEIFRDPGNGATPTRTVPALPPIQAMRQQAINFCRAIRGEAPPPCDAAEALADLGIAVDYIRMTEST